MPAKNLRLNRRQFSFFGVRRSLDQRQVMRGHRGHVLVYNKVVLYIGNHGQGLSSAQLHVILTSLKYNLILWNSVSGKRWVSSEP